MSIKKKANRMHAYTPDYAVAPGETLAEVLDSLSKTQKECAKRCGLTEQTIVRVIKGDQPISYETADRLEMVTGVPASMWNALELQYQTQNRKIQQKQAYEASIAWLESVPTKDLIKRGVLDASQSKADMVGEASRFYGVANVDAWKDVSKWLSPSKAMILVSLRGKEEDLFWFSFFHEAYHILHGEKKRLYIAEERSSDEEEQKAGGFAAQILIPKEWNEAISRILTKEEVVSIAKQLSISPGIVAGRYRHLTGRWSYSKDLTRSYCWDESIGKTKVQS